jgi:type I restriction enzyme S subunit
MDKDWIPYTLGDICDNISYGYTESATLEKIGPKFLRITDIQNDFINWSSVPYCPITKDNHKKYKLEVGDIVIARTGASTGVTAIFKDEGIDAVFASYLIRYRINKQVAEPFYIGHLLKSQLWKNYVGSIIGGSAQPGANAKQFARFEFILPPIKEQTSIASILSSLDDKIELNLQMNQTIEEMAQAIFKEWFFKFNFPGFDGEMVNGLPKGWNKGFMGEMIELSYGKALKADIRIGGEYPVIGSSGIVGYHNEFLVEAPGIVIGRKGTIGEVIWLEENFFPIDTTFYVKDLMGVNGLYFYFYLLKQQDFKKIGSDSAVPGLNRNEAMRNDIVIPSIDVINSFNDLVKGFFDKKYLLSKENKSLIEIRDSILPRLMSGKININ